jgi:hypothetical protein
MKNVTLIISGIVLFLGVMFSNNLYLTPKVKIVIATIFLVGLSLKIAYIRKNKNR